MIFIHILATKKSYVKSQDISFSIIAVKKGKFLDQNELMNNLEDFSFSQYKVSNEKNKREKPPKSSSVHSHYKLPLYQNLCLLIK